MSLGPGQSAYTLTAGVCPTLKAKVQQLAEHLGISQADLVRAAVLAYLQSTDQPKPRAQEPRG